MLFNKKNVIELLVGIAIAVMITGQVIIGLEIREINRRMVDIRKCMYELEKEVYGIGLEMSLVTVAGTNLGVIGERVTVNGEKGKR